MNREIRFRGKRVDNGEWVEGYIADMGNEACIIKPYEPYWDEAHKAFRCHPSDIVPVDPSTVGQFTGLKDKDGKEIYEGDIAKDPDGVMYAVRWQRFSAAWEFYNSEASMLFVMRCPDMFEVIGNIYDNPDLLKG